jgi:transcriptional regulator with XRE-family HTH domain
MINIVEIVKREIEKKHLSVTKLAKKLNLNQSTIYDMYKRKTLKVSRLEELSNALEYNFFRELAQKFPYKKPVYNTSYEQNEKKLIEEIEKLKEDNKILKTKIDVFETVIEKLGS